MDEFYFHCPHCAEEIKAYTDMIGKIGECPGCGSDITIPYPTRKRNPEKSQPEFVCEKKKEKRGITLFLLLSGAFIFIVAIFMFAITTGLKYEKAKKRKQILTELEERRKSLKEAEEATKRGNRQRRYDRMYFVYSKKLQAITADYVSSEYLQKLDDEANYVIKSGYKNIEEWESMQSLTDEEKDMLDKTKLLIKRLKQYNALYILRRRAGLE